MELMPGISSFLVQNFQEFYRELLIQKEYAYRTLDPHFITDDHAAKEVIDATATDKIQHKLKQMFERFSLNAQNQVGEFAVSHFQEALYVMVALTDEIFISFKWPGQKRWEDNLLEAQIFHTQIAGELLFRKLDELIEANDPARNDLCVVYLFALSLGFSGKYQGENDEGKIAWYRDKLYTMFSRRPPTLMKPGRPELIGDLYHHSIAAAPGKGLPDLRSWLMTFASIIVVFVFVSSVLWYKVVRDMDVAIGQILKQTQQLGQS